MDLKEKSIQVIKDNQAQNGAYIASPNFETYRYCWLRDGSFTAYAMDRSGEHESAERFLDWVNQTLTRYRPKIDRLLKKKQVGEVISHAEFLPARFTLEGYEANDDWTNFQLDGYGTWLWALASHLNLTGEKIIPAVFLDSVRATVTYLLAFWDHPNYDCWEENGDHVHTSTLACIYGGLRRINHFLQNRETESVTEDIRRFINQNCVRDRKLTKFAGDGDVDASLLWASIPFQVVHPEDEMMRNTVKDIEVKLFHEGGVHRYPEDTYYGGGEWLLLSSWLGWYYVRAGRTAEAIKMLKWVESQADDHGNMPEQITYHPNDFSHIQPWIDRWGPVASPLLWSHAMYLVLLAEIVSKDPAVLIR